MYKIKLSPYHKIFYNEWKLAPLSSQYNIVFDQTIANNLDIQRLQNALHRFIGDYVILNSHILEISDELYWVKNTSINDLEYISGDYTKQQIYDYVSNPFDLENEPLYRFAVFKEADGSYRFIIVLHHILIDGTAFDSFIASISNYYSDTNYTIPHSLNQQIESITSTTEKLYTNLANYATQNQQFWQDALFDIDVVDMRFVKLYPNSKDMQECINSVGELRFSFGKKECAQLEYVRDKYSLSSYFYGQMVFALTLFKYTAQKSFAISYPVGINSNGNFIGGTVINTNLFPYLLDDQTTISDLIRHIHELKQEICNHNFYPIIDIINSKNKDLLEVFFGQTNLKDKPFAFNDIKTIGINKEFNIDLPTKLLFEQEQSKQELKYRIRFNMAEIDELILKQFIAHYKKLFISILDDLNNNVNNKLINSYSILDEKEHQNIIYGWNKTRQSYPENKTIHQLFEEQVSKHPNSIAIVFENKQLTYHELNRKSNQLGYYLRQTYDIKGDDLIALCLDRSEDMIIAILAVLKSGGAYVPLNLDYPDKRISSILKDTCTKAVITNACYNERITIIISQTSQLNPHYKHCVAIFIDNQETQNKLIKYSMDNLNVNISSNNLAYVIYTSGTTGEPKGVMIEHKSVINYVTYLIRCCQINEDIVGNQYANFSFDAHVIEIYPILLAGAKLYLIKEEDKLDPNKINSFFIQNNISYAFLPPQIAQMFFVLKNTSLKNLIVGGDKLNTYTNQRYRVINAYGPTEATVQSNSFIIDKSYNNIPVGKPIQNVTNYVLDMHLSPLPIGAIGELYIGGDGVARGYLNKPHLTAKKFISNPFMTLNKQQQTKNGRLYKTGDLVRYLPDGNIEYIGRNDFQVKIRGFRIELSEIESKLSQYPEVQQVVVLAWDNEQSKHLIAYYVAKYKLDELKILNYLASELPDYMLPSKVIFLKQLPLTINGKLDRNRLPSPNLFDNSNVYEPPSHISEQLISDKFIEVLNLKEKKIGVNDDFFKLGGTSIKAITLASILQSNFDINITDIFNLRTPKQLALKPYLLKNTLQQKLKRIKIIYQERPNVHPDDINHRLNKYFYETQHLQIDNLRQKQNVTNILLTGATGYLGCNLLNQLLNITAYTIFVLIRAGSTQDAYARLNKKFQSYFGKTLDDVDKSRLVVLKADIEEKKLGLSITEYQNLVNTIDSVIHAAALVKYYGVYSEFYSANVQATLNLLELSALTNLKIFHYISTYSVLNFVCNSHLHGMPYIENDFPDISQKYDNLYVYTKMLAEHEVIKYRSHGISSNIYRLGNLAFMSENYRLQENIRDNAFLNWLQCIFELQCMPQEINNIEMSPADLTAQAIVKLFDKQHLLNNTYHVFNPYLFIIPAILNNGIIINTVSLGQFIDMIIQHLDDSYCQDLIIKFLLRQGWLCEPPIIISNKQILQDKTQQILKHLGFEWLPITNQEFNLYIAKSENKMAKKPKIIEDLERVTKILPSPIYWENKESIILGANEPVLKEAGVDTPNDYVGKSLHELYPKDMADNIKQHNEEVMRTGQVLSQEESIRDVKTGIVKHYIAIKAPLYDDDGMVIGIVGTSINITAQKEAERLKHDNRKLEAQNQMNKIILEKETAEAERLKLENEVHKLENAAQAKLLEQEAKFKQFVGQMVHDIQSPLASLRGIVEESGSEIPEEKRITLKQASMRISDIAQHMLTKYKNKAHDEEQAHPVLVSAALLEVVSEKRYEYKTVEFETKIDHDANFSFIRIEHGQFKRMISNLINNAVEALENKPDGKVEIELSANTEEIIISLEDNGKGMPKELTDKIRSGISVTAGKKDGSGIGLTQVRDTLRHNFGELTIYSTEGCGTKIMLLFPKIAAPGWIAKEIKIIKNDTIIILDDDESIHTAWDNKLQPILARMPTVKTQHFSDGIKVINFINSLPEKEKKKICLLTDYELLNQEVNGLQVIEQTGIKRATLVTSYYANAEVRMDAADLKVKIIPKELAFAVAIKLDKKLKPGSKKVDMVWVDDAKWFIDEQIRLYYKKLNIDIYYEPESFLENIAQYPKDTKILLDTYYHADYGHGDCIAKGLPVARQLHKKGYTNLFMLVSEELNPKAIPDYLTVILKTDREKIKILDKL